MTKTGTIALALLAGCATGEQLTAPSRAVPAADGAAKERLGYHGDGLEVIRLRQTGLAGGLDGGVAAPDGSRVHLSMFDVTCAMNAMGVVDYDEDVEEDEPEDTVGTETGPTTSSFVAGPARLHLVDPTEGVVETWEVADVQAAGSTGGSRAALDGAGVLHWLDGGPSVSLGVVGDLGFLDGRALVAADPVLVVDPGGQVGALPFGADRLDVDPASGRIVTALGDTVRVVSSDGAVAWSLDGLDVEDVGLLSDVGVAWALVHAETGRRVLLRDLATGADLGYLAVPFRLQSITSSLEGGLLVEVGESSVTLWAVAR